MARLSAANQRLAAGFAEREEEEAPAAPEAVAAVQAKADGIRDRSAKRKAARTERHKRAGRA